MNKEKCISNCKQEELTITLLFITVEILLFGFIFPEVANREGDLLWICCGILIIAITLFIFWKSNKNMMLCYKLIKQGGVKKMAKVERADVYPFKHDVYLSVVFRLLETDEIYKWKEYYRIAISNFDLGHQLHRYLGQYPEVEVIVDANNHEQHYVLLEPVMLDPIRQNQRVYKMINVVLEVILIFMTVILLGKYFL